MSRRSDSYQPRYTHELPPRSSGEDSRGMYHFGGSRRGRGDFSFKPRIAERDLLTHVPTTAEIPVFTPARSGHRFKDAELTDSEEEPMEEDSDDQASVPLKRRKLDNGDADIVARPRWSNPDPYTSLPPPPDSNGKHIDVVKMIRKSRNEPLTAQNASAEQDDFISFDTFDDPAFAPPSNAPSGPRAEIPRTDRYDPSGQMLGKRKRIDDYDRPHLIGNPNRVQFHANGAVLAAWRPTSGVSSTPWLRSPRSTDSPIVTLHKEILDFYEWVRPHEFEFAVREDLIGRLNQELNRYRVGELKSFGSYAAGLYLPTGDMDLVYFTRGRIVDKNTMYDLGRFLKRSRIARADSLVVIPHAKVPIIKFVDALTGLRVDLSFNNNTGIIANDTFKKWQAVYPALPIIVAVIKQFLMIRGLNDNSVGGLGGFATICMAASVIQNLPVSKQHNLGEVLLEFFNLYGNLLDFKTVGIRLDPPGFIDKYSYAPLRDEKSDRLMIVDPNRPDNNITGGSNQVARVLHLFSKTHDQLIARLDERTKNYESTTSFSFLEEIIGGDFTAYYVSRRALHAVYQKLHPKSEIPPPPAQPSDEPPSPPPPPPPPPPPLRSRMAASNATSKDASEDDGLSSTDEKDVGSQPKTKSQKLLARIKRLCPELLPQLAKRTSITRPDALAIGGWRDKATMLRALSRREKQLTKA